jgi:hypothetical protein
LNLLLLVPAGLMFVAMIVSWVRGSIFPGLLAGGVGVALLLAWRMASDLEPVYLKIEDGRLEVRLRWNLFHIDLTGARARRLTAEEQTHLESLVSAGGIVASSGGYDSHKLGELDLYASDLRNSVLLEAEDVRYIMTPDDADGFVDAVGRIHSS